MDELPGTLGTPGSLSLRLGQTLFSAAALLLMSVGVQSSRYTVFRYLVTIVSLTIFWSFALAVIDLFTMVTGCKNLRQRGFMIIIAIGDWVLSLLSLSAPCSSAGVADFLLLNGAPLCPPKNCSNGRYQLSAAMAFLSWFLILVSSLVNFWMLASL
ncbi:CASP-like protein 5C1 [Nymphaea colorata]|nr:CASP-like protein 5C1 [Nymphaea colorata]